MWQQPHDFNTTRRVRYDAASGHAPEPESSPPRGHTPHRHDPKPTSALGPEGRDTAAESSETAHTQQLSAGDNPDAHDSGGLHKPPRKLTVTRVAARRSIELTQSGFATFQRAAKADGAEESGLTALVYATMANFATDAAIAVALANTLFFASATAESVTKVALYLVITIAPFAVIAPVIGPMLDRLQHGRRIALAGSFAIRVLVAGLLIFNIDNWALYPLALCMMVLSKSFSVLKSAVTPRVLPPGIDLVRTNSRLTVFGLVGGTLCAGGVAALIAKVTGSTGALLFAAALAAAGMFLSLRIPAWVENTEGEVPATLGYHGDDSRTEVLDPSRAGDVPPTKRRQPLGRSVVTGLWGNSTVRVLTGFLTFYVAFVVKATDKHGVQQIAMLGIVGAAAAIGNFAGNATGARMKLGRPQLIVLICTVACVTAAVAAAVLDSLLGAALATLIAAGASALAKVSLDASIQDDLPPESVASGFGRSETVLQLAWVFGGALGVLLPTLWMPTMWWKGFAVVSVIMALGLIQTVVSYRGHSLLPGLGGNRPQHAKQEIPGAHGAGNPPSNGQETR
ncbi:MFS transporter [Nocardia sp. NPDC004340]|uniref:MFS transporter n=1 Tax=Nocardia sp. CA-136227 TaxID=3239979 RepID=UPI003D99308B